MEFARLFLWGMCAGTVIIIMTLGAPPAGAVAAGEGKVNITPSLEEFPTISLAGFGERQGKPAQGVHDDMFSRALVLADGRTKVALVSTDLLIIPGGLKQRVAQKVADIGLDENTVLLAAAHDHSAPECLHPGGDVWPLAFGKFHPQFFEWMATRIAESIRIANMRVQGAQLGFASARLEGFNRNRRDTGGDLVDPTMTVMKVANLGIGPAARTLALVVNFTAHPTIMGASNFDISGEWPGAMCQALENALRRQGIALFFNGAQGDQTHTGDFGSGWERVDAYGKALAEKAWELAQSIEMSSDVALGVNNVMWTLPEPRVSPAFIESTGQEYEMTPESATALIGSLFPTKHRLQAIRVGDGVFMSVPGEAIVELGLAMKDDAVGLGAKYPVVVGLGNDYIGYILSPEQYGLGGYESGTSFYGPQLGAILVSQMKQTARPLFAPQ
ncbi:MAG: neutral/alkaline non-lysosomal ceramidase N-terminal domain-containing protein [Armatimonadota bacterium]|nr:MAG: neutral/alkaline non-lysosomal ceramidase N-terminal domain-containing protein [Armatimonadota bacterium]